MSSKIYQIYIIYNFYNNVRSKCNSVVAHRVNFMVVTKKSIYIKCTLIHISIIFHISERFSWFDEISWQCETQEYIILTKAQCKAHFQIKYDCVLN